MSSVAVNTEPQKDTKRSTRREWTTIVVVCLLLGVSGGIRHFRDWYFFGLAHESERLPFPLDEFPKSLGSWHALDEGRTLEPEISRIAGAKASLIREYHDERTGQDAIVMILYGLADVVWPHTPIICYPAQGFQNLPALSRNLDITVPDETTKARFREDHFSKEMLDHIEYRIVYHSFLNASRWDFDVGKNWKSFRYHPGMFRVQVQRQGQDSGRLDESAMEELLGRIVHEIDQRLPSGSVPKS